jgi:ferredoxin-NADP reductase
VQLVQTLLDRKRSGKAVTGNPALTSAAGSSPARTGFRPCGYRARTAKGVTSLVLEPSDEQPLAAALPGQFVVLRLRSAPDAPALLPSCSLSGEPRDDRYRLSTKREIHGAAAAYVETQVRIGDVLEQARHAAASR